MKIDVNITRFDLVRINFRVLPKISGTWVLLVTALCSTIIASAYVWKDDLSNLSNIESILSFVVAPLLITIFTISIYWILFILVHAGSASERTGLGKHSYEISETGLTETTRLNTETSKWESFQKVWDFGSYILLKKHWAALHIFPARDFTSRDHYNSFYLALRAHVENDN